MKDDISQYSQQVDLAEQLGITTCLYGPQANKHGLPSYDTAALLSAVNCAEADEHFVKLVLPLSIEDKTHWQAYFSTPMHTDGAHANSRHANDKELLESIVQTIIEHGQELLPLLAILRKKADSDTSLAKIVKTLQERLSLGIHAACSLAPREIEVLELAATGASNVEIAKKLNLQVVTITKTLGRAYRKLDAKNRAEAVHKWMLLRNA